QMAGFPEEALLNFRKAQEIFSLLVPTRSVKELKASVEVDQAAILCQEGQCSTALQLLRAARPYLSYQSQYWSWLRYYEALGNALMEVGEISEAKQALNAGVEVSERALSSIHAENYRSQWQRHTH